MSLQRTLTPSQQVPKEIILAPFALFMVPLLWSQQGCKNRPTIYVCWICSGYLTAALMTIILKLNNSQMELVRYRSPFSIRVVVHFIVRGDNNIPGNCRHRKTWKFKFAYPFAFIITSHCILHTTVKSISKYILTKRCTVQVYCFIGQGSTYRSQQENQLFIFRFPMAFLRHSINYIHIYRADNLTFPGCKISWTGVPK
jgi:hypothetical protein